MTDLTKKFGANNILISKMPKKKCRYGRSCYRKNDQHLRDYDHGSGSESGDEVTATEVGFENIHNAPLSMRYSFQSPNTKGLESFELTLPVMIAIRFGKKKILLQCYLSIMTN